MANKNSESIFKDLVDAARRLDAVEDDFFASADEEQLAKVVEERTKATKQIKNDDDRALQLGLLADLAGQLEGIPVVRSLLSILDEDEPYVRIKAGEALKELAYARFTEVANEVESVLKENREESFALRELPFILSEITDPDPFTLLAKFLLLKDAEAVASAIEVLSMRGDDRLMKLLQPLLKDTRTVMLDESDESVSLGELASEALASLEQ